jgi:uncharacterized protein YbbK (DUF523 family)
MRIVSACLCGINCKYNGDNNRHEEFVKELRDGQVLPLCPEQLGGLPTPRGACEIKGGSGEDVGAQECLAIMRLAGVDEAVLQRRSPSCGAGKIYNGSFSGRLIEGDGVTAALLKKYGIKVWNDEDYLQHKGEC